MSANQRPSVQRTTSLQRSASIAPAPGRKVSIAPNPVPPPTSTKPPLIPPSTAAAPSGGKRKSTKSSPSSVVDPRDQNLDDEERETYIQRRRPVLFLLLLGLCALCFGTGVTWYGAREDLRDFLVIGPGTLVIGGVMVLVAAVFLCRDLRRHRLLRAVEHYDIYSSSPSANNNNNKQQYNLPPSPNHLSSEPTDQELYGEKVMKKSAVSVPELARPIHSVEQSDQPTYSVTLPAKQSSTPKQTTDKQSGDKQEHDKQTTHTNSSEQTSEEKLKINGNTQSTAL